MKISVIGTFVRDIIYPWKSEPVKSIGGLFYTISYLANLAGKETQIWPVCFVGEDFYDQIVHELRKYENVRTDCIKKLNRENTTVKLSYTSQGEREEATTEPMPALQAENLDLILDSDLTIVNLITGTDLELKALKYLRLNSRAQIYLDLHSRTLGIDENGKRYLKRPHDWADWFREVDIVQMNENEAFLLSESPRESKSLVEFGKKVLDINPSICHITLEERGSYLFHRHNNQSKFLKIDAESVDEVVDRIGCGDAFEAAFSLHYFKSGHVANAAQFAHKIAAENCRFYGSSGIEQVQRYRLN